MLFHFFPSATALYISFWYINGWQSYPTTNVPQGGVNAAVEVLNRAESARFQRSRRAF